MRNSGKQRREEKEREKITHVKRTILTAQEHLWGH